jgi:hypothetical protein
MLFVLIGRDAVDAAVLRKQHLQAHLDWVAGVMDRIRVAGPVMDPVGETCMSLYVLEAGSEAAAREFIAQDPYFRNGVWRELTVQPFVAAAGTWVGGASWLAR